LNYERTLFGGAAQLSLPGVYHYNVAYQFFNPTVSGSYSIGIADTSYDPVLIVYSGQTSFPTSSPGSGAIGLNDDGLTLDFNGLAISSEYNPIIRNLSLTAGTNYLLAATSYDFSSDIPLPLTFFVYGPGQVAVGGSGTIPEPSSYAAILGGLVLAAVGARRRKRAV
jgi:hypothetical protein